MNDNNNGNSHLESTDHRYYIISSIHRYDCIKILRRVNYNTVDTAIGTAWDSSRLYNNNIMSHVCQSITLTLFLVLERVYIYSIKII